MSLSLAGNTSPPINQRTEYIKEQSFHAVFGISSYGLRQDRTCEQNFRTGEYAASHKRRCAAQETSACDFDHLYPPRLTSETICPLMPNVGLGTLRPGKSSKQ